MPDASSTPVIRLRGVRQNNLKNFDLDLPLGRLIVLTGPSGSGKSSLAFDTLFAEGQRRYIETFSPYARQFFDRMDKPAVDAIEGIPPAIAIEQRNAVRSTRSTVGTMTELCDHLKLLWPHLAQLHCRGCGQPVRRSTPQDIWHCLQSPTAAPTPTHPDLLVTFDLPLAEKLSLADSLSLVAKQGYQRLLVDGRVLRLDDLPADHPAFATSHRLTVVQDRVRATPAHRARFVEACEQAYHFGKGRLTLWNLDANGHPLHPRPFSNRLHCAPCNLDYHDPSPALFSFNHPVGACPECKGFGRVIRIDYQLAIPDPSRTLDQGAVKPWQSGMSAECQQDLLRFCRLRHIPTHLPFRDLLPWQQQWVIEGDQDYGLDEAHEWPKAWYGVKGYFRWLESKAYKMHVRVLLSRYRAYAPCPSCQGARFQPDTLLYLLTPPIPKAELRNQTPATNPSPLTLADFYALPIRRALTLVSHLAHHRPFGPRDPLALALEEVRTRLAYLDEAGLGYLTLDRPTRTLSGGETERVNLTTCLGTRLVNTLYILDEPSVGLHPRDTDRLVRILERLRDAGNTVVVVEHEAAIIRAADQIVDLGPASGERGGQVVFQGPLAAAALTPQSLTGAYLAGSRRIDLPPRRPVPSNHELHLAGASRHNLKQLNLTLPLERLVCVTGVSRSAKTTPVREVLHPTLSSHLAQTAPPTPPSSRPDTDDDPAATDDNPEPSPRPTVTLRGWEHLDQLVLVDQSPLGKTPRSNPAAYIGAFDHVREFLAETPEAKTHGLVASEFSFNSALGQCQRCRGAGFEKIEMQFLSDVFIRCPDCDGRRYRPHVLAFKLQGWSVADLLDATVDEAVAFLQQFPASRPARRAVASLQLLRDVGLGYLRLGQPINTLSGGESQRLKLVSHLAETPAASGERPPVNGNLGANPTPPPGERTPPTNKNPHPARRCLFLFDEPTTGLHFDDVRTLLAVFQRLVDAGHSVVVIEHNLDVIKCADWIIDLGPEAGEAGGQIVACGTPETVAACPASHTGRYLRAVLHPAVPPTPPLPLREAAPALAAPEHAAIVVAGAREHNLKNLAVHLPRNQFVVITGVSGSGKSTLAFDVLFNEGQRRFLDSMNAYARQFVEQMARPDVDRLIGLPPTVSIEQRTSRGGGKSTVATVTEIQHFLRLLFARLGTQHCPTCHQPVEAQTRDALQQRLHQEASRRGDLLLLAPVVRNRKGFHSDVAQAAARNGFAEIRADGRLFDTSKPFRLDRFREHNIELVVGVFAAPTPSRRPSSRRRPPTLPTPPPPTHRALVDRALQFGQGVLLALDNHGQTSVHSTERACPTCGRSFEPLDPKHFSYNSPQGWCPRCRGFGELFYLPADVDRGARADAIEESWFGWMEGQREPCPECGGARLNPVARAVHLGHFNPRPVTPAPPRTPKNLGPSIDDFNRASVLETLAWFRRARPRGPAATVARDILPEITERLKFLEEVGLGYLQMGRSVTTLSGGEAQRIRLAAQLGSNLSGVLYILDEPTIGLHARDNQQLLATLAALKNRGNSLVVVEHDEDTMRHADYIIDLGPGAGVRGGQVVAAGTLDQLLRHPQSVTGQCLRHQAEKQYPSRGQRRPVTRPHPAPPTPNRNPNDAHPPPAAHPWLTLHGASVHNLHNLTIAFPLQRFVTVTGVSGSGKSSLVRECLLPALKLALASRRTSPPPPDGPQVHGWESLQAVYEVDQSPIGRTPRSTPATYVGFFDAIRALFAQTPEARMRGYGPGRFSFNSPQGRCPACQGAGIIKLEMNFLPPAYVRCESCTGTRFNPDTLDVQFLGRNIAQVLDLSVEEALSFFQTHPPIHRALEALHDTGLDYLRLGQTSPTLSGGEAQRVKLVSHLLSGLKSSTPTHPKSPARHNLFVLEEPTIGLHMNDVRRLVDVLQRLVDAGHSVLVIEHNLDLIAEADWIIDLGPEGGQAGGRLVAAGPPERVARNRRSHTGRFLRNVLRIP